MPAAARMTTRLREGLALDFPDEALDVPKARDSGKDARFGRGAWLRHLAQVHPRLERLVTRREAKVTPLIVEGH